MADALKGRCLCGAVAFTATPEAMEMALCHCAMCRRWAGGPMMAVTCGSDVAVTGEENLGVYQSSDWGERCFCSTCGATLFWRMRDGSHTAISAQAFEDPAAFALTTEIFIDEKPDNYAFAGETHKMTGAEVIAMFTGGASNADGEAG